MADKAPHIQSGWDKGVSISFICGLKNSMVK